MSLLDTSRYNSRQFINKAEWLRQIPTDICKLVRSKLINSISLITEITFSKKPRKSYTECNVAFSQLELGSVYLLVCLLWSYMFRMFFCVAALLFVISFRFERPSMAQAKLYNDDCTFVELKTSRRNGNKTSLMQLTSQLPSSTNLVYSCTVKTDNTNSILYLRGKRNKDSKEGKLNVKS